MFKNFSILFFLFFSYSKSYASPINFMSKFYGGLMYSAYRHNITGTHIDARNQFFDGITKFENFQLIGGWRFLKYFSIEGSVLKYNDSIKSNGQTYFLKSTILGIDALAYLPITSFLLDSIGTGVEFFLGAGIHYMILSHGYSNITVPKYSTGLQLRVLDSFAVRASYDFYHLNAISKVPIPIDNFSSIKVGFFYFF
jgi:hypothetical protein